METRELLPLHARPLTDFILGPSAAAAFEFMGPSVLSIPEDAALLRPSPTSGSYSLSDPSSWVVPEPWEEERGVAMCHLWLSTPLAFSALGLV